MSKLVPSSPDDEHLETLATRVRELEEVLAERCVEMARTEAELTAFKIRYRHDVGRLHEQLDELELAIAEAELGEIAKKLDAEGTPATSPPGSPRAESAPRLTSDAVRKLFRDVAKAIHPDLALDAHARDQRHRLMVEANRAYRLGDEERLRSILRTWEQSPDAVVGSDAEAMRQRLLRRLAQIEGELDAYAKDLAELQESPLWKLKAMVDEAASCGKDLVGDMVRRLERDIVAAQNRLDAMRWHPR